MIRAVRHPWAGSIGTLAWPALAFAVLLVSDATTAGAQSTHCGSYASRPGDIEIREALGLSSLPDRPSDIGPGDRAGWPRPADRPCDGPSCSRGSDPRPAMPTTISTPPLEHWACLGPVSRRGGPPPRILLVADRHARLDPIPSRIFHPPRAV